MMGTVYRCPKCRRPTEGCVIGEPCISCRTNSIEITPSDIILAQLDHISELKKALKKADEFIYYASYELKKGKSKLGDQFPKEGDATEIRAYIKKVLGEA